MATGQSILDRLKRVKAQAEEDLKRGILPLAAYYGREEDQEAARSRMYEAVARVTWRLDAEEDEGEAMVSSPQHRLLLDSRDAITFLNANSSPIEFLVARGEMELREDEVGMGGMRYHTALRFRDLLDGAQVKGLKSPSWEGTGGGGGGPVDIRSYQLDCIRHVCRVRDSMPEPWLFTTLEAVVFMDEWLDLYPDEAPRADKREAARKQRMKTIKALHYALDRAAATLGYMFEAEFKQRWPDGAPPVPPSVRRRSRATKAANQLALLTLPSARTA